MATYDQLWAKITTIFFNLKQVVALAEELGADSDTFIHPIKEQRDALDHIVRAEAVRLGLDGESRGEDYSLSQLDKAVGHLYRGFFDAADWLALSIRERISLALREYSNACVMAVLPTYYHEYKPFMIEACEDIAALRGKKDIGKDSQQIIDEVERYRAVLGRLLLIHRKVVSALPALQEYADRQAGDRRSERRWDFKTKIGAALAAALATALFGWVTYQVGLGNGAKASPTPSPTPSQSQAVPPSPR